MTDPVTINTPDLHRNIIVKLHALQRQGVACDVILAAVDGEILAHKVILMAVSTYFRRRLMTMLLEEKHPKLFIQGKNFFDSEHVRNNYFGKLEQYSGIPREFRIMVIVWAPSGNYAMNCDRPNGSIFLFPYYFTIPNFEFRNLHYEFRNS